MKKRKKYSSELPRQMYSYFLSCVDGSITPSYSKFARSIGRTTEEVEAYRKHDEFDRAYRECGEIRRDYLIDSALTKRFDQSIVKFLLAAEFGMGEKQKNEEDTHLNVTLEVLSDKK